MSAAPARGEAAPVPAVAVRDFAAWAPGLETREAWEAWARAPEPLGAEGHPDARFLPAMLRRRCTPLSRIMLKVAFEGCPDEAARGRVRTVFASRHGSINESIELLEKIARGERLSPAKFSHTVHNAQAGLFSIAAGNRAASSSLSGCEDTFGCGLLEAWTHLERAPEEEVLLVMGDVPLAPDFAELVDEPASAYGVALRLAAADAAPADEAPRDAAPSDGAPPVPRSGRAAPLGPIALRVEPPPEAPATPPWPHAAECLRWLLAGEPESALALDTPHHRWILERTP